MKRGAFFGLLAGVFSFLGAFASLAADHANLIVGFRGPVDENLVRRHHGFVVKHLVSSRALAVEMSVRDVSRLRMDPRVKYVEPDAAATTMDAVRPFKKSRRKSVAAQPAQSTPWGVTRVQGTLVLNSLVLPSPQVNVAVVDTGIYYTHPDLVGNVFAGPTFVDGTSSSLDDEGHGTHVAGTIGAVNNAIGVIGVAPEANVYGVKVMDRFGSGFFSDIISGIDWSADNGMRVINMSLGGTFNSSALQTSCDDAVAAGVFVTAAAGNGGSTIKNYPGAYASVVCVSAIDSANKLTTFSTYGTQVDLAAPGLNVLSTVMPNRYEQWAGTSMATPHVAGAAALVFGSNAALTNAQVRTKLESFTLDLGTVGFDNKYGNGLVQSYEAITN